MTPPVSSAPLIEARGVVVRHGRRRVLDRIDVSVAPGEIVTLIGPNGAGKTTLVRVLLGLQPADAGVVRRKPGLRLGYLPQRLSIDPTLPLTVRRFLRLTANGSTDVDALLDEVGARSCSPQQLAELSGGELQRVLLARALAREPELLVLDEPVQGVDFAGQIELYRLIAHLRDRRGCGILMVSHDLHLVMSATDRVLCLNQHLCCSGAPEAVSRHPEYLRLFGPRAAAELAVYTHHHDHRHTPSGEVVPVEDRVLHGEHEHDHAQDHGHDRGHNHEHSDEHGPEQRHAR
jgi:zinc transport system ATP-binding protein